MLGILTRYQSKSTHYVDDFIRTRETSINSNSTSSIKSSIYTQCLRQVWIGSDKRWRSYIYFDIDCFQQFSILNRALWIWLFLPLSNFVSENCLVKFGGNWTKSIRQAEGGTMCPPHPTTFLTTKYPSLNRVKLFPVKLKGIYFS